VKAAGSKGQTKGMEGRKSGRKSHFWKEGNPKKKKKKVKALRKAKGRLRWALARFPGSRSE
jgi:hypothetical protein